MYVKLFMWVSTSRNLIAVCMPPTLTHETAEYTKALM